MAAGSPPPARPARENRGAQVDRSTRGPDDPPEAEAVVNARRRLALLVETVGRRHPDYATGLNQLALLLIMRGDPDAAEPLLREALEVRRASLGEHHPDFATNLSSLGGLLWARGALDEARPLLERAADVRLATLGPDHPKTLVSHQSLEQLRRAIRDAAVAAATRPVAGEIGSITVGRPPSPAPPAPAPAFEPPADRADALGELDDELAALTAAFEALSERLLAAAGSVRDGRLPPVAELERPAAEARGRFSALCDRGVAEADALGVPRPAASPDDLGRLTDLVTALHEASLRRRQAAAERREAVGWLQALDRLACPSDPEFAPLRVCRAAARAALNALESAAGGGLPTELRPLLDGTHPYRTLLALAAAGDETDDATWSDLYEALRRELGTPLAVAAARGRILPSAS